MAFDANNNKAYSIMELIEPNTNSHLYINYFRFSNPIIGIKYIVTLYMIMLFY